MKRIQRVVGQKKKALDPYSKKMWVEWLRSIDADDEKFKVASNKVENIIKNEHVLKPKELRESYNKLAEEMGEEGLDFVRRVRLWCIANRCKNYGIACVVAPRNRELEASLIKEKGCCYHIINNKEALVHVHNKNAYDRIVNKLGEDAYWVVPDDWEST